MPLHALGSTKLLTDADGDVTDTYTYDAWGNAAHNGETDQPCQYAGQLGYYAHYQDENLDLLQLGVRFYDPEVGRFAQRDRVRRDRYSSYPYANDRPSALVDPSGKETRTEASCQADRNECQDDAFANFNRCISEHVTPGGAYDAAACTIGCLPTLVWGKKAYELCLLACGVVSGGAVCIDIASCGRVLEAELDSCEEAYNWCIRKIRE